MIDSPTDRVKRPGPLALEIDEFLSLQAAFLHLGSCCAMERLKSAAAAISALALGLWMVRCIGMVRL